jgi:hypothetical protein
MKYDAQLTPFDQKMVLSNHFNIFVANGVAM